MNIYLFKGYHGLSQIVRYIDYNKEGLIFCPFDKKLEENYKKIFPNFNIKKIPEIKIYGNFNISFFYNFKNIFIILYYIYIFFIFFLLNKNKINNIYHFYPINSFGYDLLCKFGSISKINIIYKNAISKNIKFIKKNKTFKNNLINLIFFSKYEKVIVNEYYTWFNLKFDKFTTYHSTKWPNSIKNIWNEDINKNDSLLILDTLIQYDSKNLRLDLDSKIRNFITSQKKYKTLYIKPHYRKEIGNFKNIFYDALFSEFKIKVIPSWIPSEIILTHFSHCISLYSSSWDKDCNIFWLVYLISKKYTNNYNLVINEIEYTYSEINEFFKINNIKDHNKNIIRADGPFCIL